MQLQILADHEGNNYWWTSGTDAGRNGDWYWASSLVAVDSFIWHDGQPNYQTYNYLMLNSGFDFEGDDQPGTSSAMPICQNK